MTETWTHQFNSEADFLDFLKMKRGNEELWAKVKYLEKAVDDYANDIVKKNETIGELKRASSPIECYVPVNPKDELPKEAGCYFADYEKEYPTQADLKDIVYFDGKTFEDEDGCETDPLFWLKKVSLPLPVESGWIKELDQKFSHCFFGQNTSFNELLEFIKTKVIK